MGFFSSIGRAFKSAGGWVKKAVHNTGGWIKHAAVNTGNWVKHAAVDTGNTVVSAAKSTGTWVAGAAGTVGHGLQGAYEATMKPVLVSAQHLWTNTLDTASSVISHVGGAANGLADVLAHPVVLIGGLVFGAILLKRVVK